MNNLPAENEKNDAFSNILRFMTVADIVLSAQEEQILNRWIFIDVLLRQRLHREEDIIDKVKEQYGVSKFTARNDIYKTQALFEGARKVSKAYLLQHHAEEIARQIKKMENEDNPGCWELLPKLYDSYTKAVNAIPDHVGKQKTPPPNIFLNVVNGQGIEQPISFEEARQKVKKRSSKKDKEEFTDFEDVSHE